MSFQGLIGTLYPIGGTKPTYDPEGECRYCDIKYCGDPELSIIKWDYGTMKDTPSPHMICDLNGIGLKWSEVKDGMLVKIKARNLHRKDGLPLYEYLYTVEGKHGKYLYQIGPRMVNLNLSYLYTNINFFLFHRLDLL